MWYDERGRVTMTTESEGGYRSEPRAITFNCLKEKPDG
jgi:hypothetical protein